MSLKTGFDVIVPHTERFSGEYVLVDVNFFPTFSGLDGFRTDLLMYLQRRHGQHCANLAAARTNERKRQREPDSVANNPPATNPPWAPSFPANLPQISEHSLRNIAVLPRIPYPAHSQNIGADHRQHMPQLPLPGARPGSSMPSMVGMNPTDPVCSSRQARKTHDTSTKMRMYTFIQACVLTSPRAMQAASQMLAQLLKSFSSQVIILPYAAKSNDPPSTSPV
jgi:hypothetical protein